MSRQVTAMMRLEQILLRFELVSDDYGLRRSLKEFVRDTADRDAVDIARNMLRHVEDGRWGYFVHARRVVSDIVKIQWVGHG
jgi:hypothetical protein